MPEKADSAPPTDVEEVQSALRRLNPEFHEFDISWPSLARIVAERDRYKAELERIAKMKTVLIGNPYRSAIREVLRPAVPENGSSDA